MIGNFLIKAIIILIFGALYYAALQVLLFIFGER